MKMKQCKNLEFKISRQHKKSLQRWLEAKGTQLQFKRKRISRDYNIRIIIVPTFGVV